MNGGVVEKRLSYEEERGKPVPSRNHAIVQTNLAIELAKHKEYRKDPATGLTADLEAVFS